MATIKYLPRPVIEVWDWQQDAECRGMDSSVFFHPSGERGARRALRAQRAKEVCARCPVLRQCRDHALSSREAYGVWGGLTEEERAELVKTARPGGLDGLPAPRRELPVALPRQRGVRHDPRGSPLRRHAGARAAR